LENVELLERRLWEAADQLRANSKLTSTEYYMPVLGLIFLRHAYTRFLSVKAAIEPKLPRRGGVARPLNRDDFARKSALFLRETSQYECLLNLPSGRNVGKAINDAMDAIEEDYPTLAGVLPRNYDIFESDLLGRLLKIFNDQALQRANGDIFGQIYEYFLMKFAMQGAQDMGEFFTPVSLVQTIVNVIEPDHGTILDPACGSGGMFVQTSHFLEAAGRAAQEAVTFYGQEKTETTIKLAKMNLAVHGLEGKILEGNTFYQDYHDLLGKANFVMANPPFNVDGVDASKIKTDPRLPFGLPGVNNKGAVSNGNYLWISYFYSYLNKTGRAGFVMSSQASSAGHGEKEVRRKIVETGDVDVMISIRSNFFYTRSVPCELWFFDKGKPDAMHDKVLMIDARSIYRKVTRKIFDFTPEQLKNITAIVWLYRGRTDKFLGLVNEYLANVCEECARIPEKMDLFEGAITDLRERLESFIDSFNSRSDGVDAEKLEKVKEAFGEFEEAFGLYDHDWKALLAVIARYRKRYCDTLPETNPSQHKAARVFEPIAEKIKGLVKQTDLVYKLMTRALDLAEKELDAKNFEAWDSRAVNKLKKELDPLRRDVVEQLKLAAYFHRQVHWLQSRFPEGKLLNVEGLVKLVDRGEIESNDWSLTAGRYIGVAPQEEDEDFDFEETLRDIHIELTSLTEEATQLSKAIERSFEELGI
jgi:type I restriction enzyme M protein